MVAKSNQLLRASIWRPPVFYVNISKLQKRHVKDYSQYNKVSYVDNRAPSGKLTFIAAPWQAVIWLVQIFLSS